MRSSWSTQTYPNYDTYYTLVWGKELANWQLPDYDVFRTPTPHPLSTLVAWAMAPFGTASDRILVLARRCSGCSASYVVTFVFTERLMGRLIALLALAVMLTRTDMQLLALRAMFDLPFYLMIFGAALLELRRPRCGWPVLVCSRWRAAAPGGVAARRRLLALPRPGDAAPALIRYALLVVAAPLIWMPCDLIVTGEPLYSLTSTREVSDEFGRNRGLLDAIGTSRVRRRQRPHRHGRRRRARPAARRLHPAPARRAAARARRPRRPTFLIIAAAGLSVIPRYMTIPSLLLSLCVAVALGGWTLVDGRTPRARRDRDRRRLARC